MSSIRGRSGDGVFGSWHRDDRNRTLKEELAAIKPPMLKEESGVNVECSMGVMRQTGGIVEWIEEVD
jgi:hypothetical protein